MNSLFQDSSHHKPSKINSLTFRNFCSPFFICVVRLSQEREASWTSWVSLQCSHREEPNFDQKRSGLSYLIPWWELKVCSFLKRRRWHTEKCEVVAWSFVAFWLLFLKFLYYSAQYSYWFCNLCQDKPVFLATCQPLSLSPIPVLHILCFSVSPISAHSLTIEDAAALPCSHASQTGPRWILANKRLQAKDTKEVD